MVPLSGLMKAKVTDLFHVTMALTYLFTSVILLAMAFVH